MKRLALIVAVAVIISSLTGCTRNVSTSNQGSADIQTVADGLAVEEKALQSEDTQSLDALSDDSIESEDKAADAEPYDDPKSLPLYIYNGDDEYLSVISDYMVNEPEKLDRMNDADVYIPYSIIGHVDDGNPDDILVYGSFNICGYDLLNSTLVAVSGSWDEGIFHLKKNSSGNLEVISAELPISSQESIKLFDPVPGLYDKLQATFNEKGESLRQEAIADYVNTNGLYISQWRDLGKAPEPVLNAPPTPEEENFYAYTSKLGYRLTYDLRQISLLDTGDTEILGKIEPLDVWTGTSMSVRSVDTKDAEEAISDALSDTDATTFDISDSTIGDNIPCKKVAYDEKISGGRIFRYICYAVPAGEKTITVSLNTTVEEGKSELSAEDLEKTFEDTLKSFSVL